VSDGVRYRIHHYPAELIDVVRLAGGARVVIRPVLPQDAPLTAAFFGNLPADARYNRFMSPMRGLPPGLVERLTDVDYRDHLALVAEVFEDGRETVVAEARYARLPDASQAEFAVSVAEAWQGRGLARLLLSKLVCRAAGAGVRRLVGETLAGNEKMLHLARKTGFTVRRSTDARGVMLLDKVIAPEAHARRTPCGEADARAFLAA
jgi:acetyltransferase